MWKMTACQLLIIFMPLFLRVTPGFDVLLDCLRMLTGNAQVCERETVFQPKMCPCGVCSCRQIWPMIKFIEYVTSNGSCKG